MRQNLFDAAFLFGAFAGSCLVLSWAWLLGLFATCWTIDIWERVTGR